MEELKGYKLQKSSEIGLFHDSIKDIRLLTKVCNALVDKVNELVRDNNDLRKKLNSLNPPPPLINMENILFERYYKCHNEWIEVKRRGWITFLKKGVEHRGYTYYHPLNGIKYRSKLKDD